MVKNSRHVQKKYLILGFLLSSLFFASSANAQFGALIVAVNKVRAAVEAIAQTTIYYIFQTPPNVGDVLVTNIARSNTATNTSAQVKMLNDEDIMTGIAPDTKNPNKMLTRLASIQASDTLLGSSGGGIIPFFSGPAQSNMQKALLLGNENLNFQSLVSPLFYTDDQQNNALNFLYFISGSATPISTFSLRDIPDSQLKPKQKLDIQSSATYQNYQVQRRQLVAHQSAALTNLYYIYARRLPIKSIKAGDTALGKDSPSAFQIEDHVATWRTSTPSWYAQMATETPTNIARETLFVLAEIQTELHRMHQENERMLALMAINQLQNVRTGKQTLMLSEKQVQDQISQMTKANTGIDSTNAQQGSAAQRQAGTLQQQQQNIRQQQQANTPPPRVAP